MEFFTQEAAGMPVYAWGIMGAFIAFLAYKVGESRGKPKSTGSGGGDRGGPKGKIK